MIPWLNTGEPFPDVFSALTETDGAAGLLAAGGDLSPQRLLMAYRNGIFPWFSEGQPILWWNTDPRMVLFTADFRISKSLKKKLKTVATDMNAGTGYRIHFDRAFETVMRACAAPRKEESGTWISEEIVAAYVRLHKMGYAHSSELWLDDELIGGAYGVSIGHMFYGESMFARASDASKIALAYLVHFLKAHGVSMIDCQQQTAHLASLGATSLTRAEFMSRLHAALAAPQISVWQPPTLLLQT
jgi:leucyl/phenylalanyl-tRNA--protein transferase